ncbi:uncharacterized protein METZ01_LOCUS96329 [marine metagenome]|uniref:Hydroxyacid dehydrogenase n=1 Tax=marine metagenome TaxID=408172 RepID=A0A381VT67_9ZZZZ
MKKILITEFMDQSALDELKSIFEVTFDPNLWRDKMSILKFSKDTEGIIIRNKTTLSKEILSEFSKLKFIGRLGVGLDNIDMDYCSEKKIKVQPASGLNADSVAEYVIQAALSLLKKIPILHQKTIKGSWPRNSFTLNEIQGKTFGFIGFGEIAKKVFKRLEPFGVHCVAHDPYIDKNNVAEFKIELIDFEKLLQLSNIISIHLPLTNETKELINKDTFKKMSKSPIIINTSRGSIINEYDLLEAYRENLITGFSLDVYEKEPVEKKFYDQISNDMNCILTPHIAGVTEESNFRVSKFIAESTIKFFKN